MRIAVLGSGSRGNAILVEGGGSRVLVDAGFSRRDLIARLGRLGVDPSTVDAIVVTHEHGDHTRGAGVFARRFNTPIYITDATFVACSRLLHGTEPVVRYRPGRAFEIGGLRFEPCMTVHDAADPVAVAVLDTDSGLRLGVATDLGRPTAQVRHALAGANFLIIEANHDEGMLHQGPYPWSVKSRIASSHGHLSNHAAARLAVELLHPRLVGVLLAHLSNDCNRPELARSVVGKALRVAGYRGFLDVAGQDDPTGLIDVAELSARSGPVQLSFL